MTTSKLIADMRAIRDGALGRGVQPVLLEEITITLSLHSGEVEIANPDPHDRDRLPEVTETRHVLLVTLTTPLEGGGGTVTQGITDIKVLHDAVLALAKRARFVGAVAGTELALEIAAGLD